MLQGALNGLDRFSGSPPATAAPDAAAAAATAAGADGAAAAAAPAVGAALPAVGFGVTDVAENPEDREVYVHIGGRQLVGLYLTIWARKPVAPHISSWQDTEVKTGSLGFGNKGAVAVRLRVYDEPLCVACSHLASGDAAGDDLKRVADFVSIWRGGAFAPPPRGEAPAAAVATSGYRCAAAALVRRP